MLRFFGVWLSWKHEKSVVNLKEYEMSLQIVRFTTKSRDLASLNLLAILQVNSVFKLHVTMCTGPPSKVGGAQEHQSKRGFNKTKQRSLEKQSECMHVSDMTVQYYTRHLQQNSSYSAACLADWFWVVLASIDQQCYLKSSFSPPTENHIN